MYITKELIELVKTRKKQLGLTQKELAERAGVGLRFIRDLEQGKQSLQLDKINQVLALFGHKMGPTEINNSHQTIKHIDKIGIRYGNSKSSN